MPKRSRRRSRGGASGQKRKSGGRSIPAAAVAAQGGAPPKVASFPHPIVRAPQPAPTRAPARDYTYVVKEVQRIALLSAGIVVLLIVMTIILRW